MLCRGVGVYAKLLNRHSILANMRDVTSARGACIEVVFMKRLILLVSLGLWACSSPTTTGGGNALDAKGGSDVGLGLPDGSTAETLSDTDVGSQDDSPFVCTDGEIACYNDTTAKICVGTSWQVKQTCNAGDICKAGNCITPTSCTAGASLGCDGFSAEIHCSADGASTFETPCTGLQLCVNGKCQTTACTPDIAQCAPGSTTSFQTCLPDGTGYGPITNCATGSQCFGGKCVSLCEQGVKFSGNIGCEYWSVDLDNDPTKVPFSSVIPEMVPHSVVISNPGQFDATITFTIQATCADASACAPSATTCNSKPDTVCGTPGPSVDLVLANNTVPAGQTKEFKMPVMNASGSGVMRKAVHVKSTQPVVAYQFNPYNAENADSNDGSLLLPQNALGTTYYAMVPAQSGGILLGSTKTACAFVTIVATLAGTTNVSFTPTRDCQVNYALGVPGDGTKPPSLKAGTTYTFALSQYDVLNIEEMGKSDMVPPGTGPGALPNMTGSKVVADKPIAVFSGHQVAEVEDDFRFGQSSGGDTGSYSTCCTEHMEEQLMPVQFWGTAAFCVKTKPRGDEVDEFVVVAGEDNVTLTTNPPSVAKYPGAPELNGVTLNAGQRARVQTDQSFMLTATGKIQVAQLLVSAGQTGLGTNGAAATLGDASMAMIPAKTQYRPDYTIQTAAGFIGNYVSVVRPAGLAITMDGNPLNASFQPFGDGTWEFGYVEFSPGTHTIESVAAPGGTGTPFGLMVYGYGTVTAYSYPGGMILK